MKAIKIPPITISDSESRDAIADALKKAKCLDLIHGFGVGDIIRLARDAEERLIKLRIPRKWRPGAVYSCLSGAEVAKSYKYTRDGVRVTLARRASGWYLAAVTRHPVYRQGGESLLLLTVEQDELAVARLRETYSIRF
jgi:hypothetical protein